MGEEYLREGSLCRVHQEKAYQGHNGHQGKGYETEFIKIMVIKSGVIMLGLSRKGLPIMEGAK